MTTHYLGHGRADGSLRIAGWPAMVVRQAMGKATSPLSQARFQSMIIG